MAQRATGTPNRGSVALAALCREYGDQKRLAGEVGADQAQFSRWIRGIRKPEAPMRTALQKTLGIDFTWWDEPVPVEAPKGAA